MALQKQVIEVPFAKGVNQKSDPRWVPIGEQTSVINGKWTKTGSLRKRRGFTQVSKQSVTATGNGPALVSAAAVETYRQAPIVSDGANLYSYSAVTGALVYDDMLSECVATRRPVAQSTTGMLQMDCAVTTNGYAVSAYRAVDVSGNTKNYATVIDVNSGVHIGANTILDTSTKAGLRCIAVGTDLWVLWTDSNGHILGSRFQTAGLPGTFQWAAPIALVTDQSSSATFTAWDVAAVDGLLHFVIAYQDNQATNHIHASRFDTNGTLVTSSNFLIGGGTLPVLAFALRVTDGETCWLAYMVTNALTAADVHIVGLDPTSLAVTVADTFLWTFSPVGNSGNIGVERVNGTTCVVVASGLAADVTWQQFNTSAALVGAQRSQPGYKLFSKPFRVPASRFAGFTGGSDRVYANLLRTTDALNSTYSVVDLDVINVSATAARARPVATVAPRAATALPTSITPSIVPISVSTANDNQFYTLVSVQESTTRVGAFLTTLDFVSQDRHQSVELGPCAYVAGGMPSVFDGAQVTEHGMIFSPPTPTANAVAGGSVDVGQHQYAVVYKWANAAGELSRSAPAFSAQVTTTGGNQTVHLSVAPYSLTTKQDLANFWSPAVTFDVYRNTINDPATFLQLSSDSMETPSDPRTVGSVTITDSVSDLTLSNAANGILYTLGGVMGDECPPSLTALCTHKSRIFGVGDDGITLWYTKQYVPGFTPGFNDAFTLTVPEDGGVVTGLASLDDHLVVFKRDRIFTLYGSGPNITNANSDFTDFIRLGSDTGCTQARSVVVAATGVYFLSPQGIHLLSRSGDTVYVGKAVEDVVNNNPFCFAADIVPADSEIRWALAPSQTSTTGVVVAYDYVQDAWSVHQYYDSDAALASSAVIGARAPGGSWCWLSPNGQLNLESATSFLDGQQWVTLQCETAWIKAGGIAGWGRFWRGTLSMEQVTPAWITIDVATNYNDSYTQSLTFNDTTISTWTTPKAIASILIGDQRTEAVRFRFTDAVPTDPSLEIGTGEGLRFLGANVEVGVKPGTKGTRLPSAQRG